MTELRSFANYFKRFSVAWKREQWIKGAKRIKGAKDKGSMLRLTALNPVLQLSNQDKWSMLRLAALNPMLQLSNKDKGYIWSMLRLALVIKSITAPEE